MAEYKTDNIVGGMGKTYRKDGDEWTLISRPATLADMVEYPVIYDAPPSLGRCARCNRGWNHMNGAMWDNGRVYLWDGVEGHTVWFKSPGRVASGRGIVRKKRTQGSSPLCEECWKTLGCGRHRWPYYRRHVDRWPEFWPRGKYLSLRKAVMRGH